MRRILCRDSSSNIFFFRGLYLVSVMLNGDRILVTNEDVLPMVEVDENYGHNLLGDFQWFMKLTFVWDDLKTLRPDLERCSSATSFYLRMKLVQAAIELQVTCFSLLSSLERRCFRRWRKSIISVVFTIRSFATTTATWRSFCSTISRRPSARKRRARAIRRRTSNGFPWRNSSKR